MKTYMLGSEEHTVGSAQTKMGRIIDETEDGARVSDVHFKFLRAAVEHHAEAEEIIGPGIDHFAVENYRAWGRNGSRHLVAVRQP